MSRMEPGAAEAAGSADLLDEIGELIHRLESHADADVQADMHALLERMDTVHRVALTHLVEAIRAMAGDAFINRLTADPAIRLLLMSYDLIAVDRRILAEEALDAVRGHLHAHGIDVVLDEVVGGAVYVRLHGMEQAGIDAEAVRRDLEAALRDGLVGFQQLELNRRAPNISGGLVALGGLRRANRPVLRAAARLEDVPAGGLEAVEVDDVPILLVSLDGDIHALHNRCGESPLPLEFGALEGDTLVCPWHGCRYDVRTGQRRDGHAGRLAVYPVSIEDGEIRVALSVQAADASGPRDVDGAGAGSPTDARPAAG